MDWSLKRGVARATLGPLLSNVSECKVMHISNHNPQGGLRDKTLMSITREGDTT